jgi:hypothetical protein
MGALARRVVERLKSRKSCTLFENDLEGLWPRDNKVESQRAEQIQAFAKTNGWSATILDPGIRVTFRKIDEAQ